MDIIGLFSTTGI